MTYRNVEREAHINSQAARIQSQNDSLFQALGVIRRHIVIKNHQKEQCNAKHVGKDRQLYVCDHNCTPLHHEVRTGGLQLDILVT